MKHFGILLCIVALIGIALATSGCGKSHKSSRSGVPASTGTGTGGTGTGGTGTGGTGTGGTGTGGNGEGVGYTLVCSFKPETDAQTSDKERFAGIVKNASGRLWKSTDNQVYIEKVTIKTGTDGDFVIVTRDTTTFPGPGGKSCYGYTVGTSVSYVGGKCLPVTFHHEFGHLKWDLDDHYGATIDCIMNASGSGGYMVTDYCEGGSWDCWGTLKSLLGLSDSGGSGSTPATEVNIE